MIENDGGPTVCRWFTVRYGQEGVDFVALGLVRRDVALIISARSQCLFDDEFATRKLLRSQCRYRERVRGGSRGCQLDGFLQSVERDWVCLLLPEIERSDEREYEQE